MGGEEGAARPQQEQEQEQPLLEGPRSGAATRVSLRSFLPPFLLFACLSACLASFSFGYTVGYTSPALEPMVQELGLSKQVASLFSSLVPLGAMPGALVAGPFSQHYGRCPALGLAAVLVVAHWLLIAFSSAIPLLLFSRFLGGMGIGVASLTVPVYIAEVASEELRGSLGSCNQLFITLGIGAVYGLGLLVVPSASTPAPSPAPSADAFSSWRLLALAGLVPGLGLILALYFLPESPRWLARHSSVALVRQTLRCLRSPDFLGHPAGKTPAAEDGEAQQQWGAEAAEAVDDRVEAELQGIMGAVQGEEAQALHHASAGPWAQARLLLQRPNLKPLLVGVGLMVVQQLSGVNSVIFFAAAIFASAGFTNPNLPSSTVAVIQVLMTLVSTLLTDRLGRRPLLLTSAAGMGLSALGLGIAFFLHQHLGAPPGLLASPGGMPLGHAILGVRAEAAATALSPELDTLAVGDLSLPAVLAISCCILYIVAYSFGVGPLPWVVMAEILPASVKGIASSLVVLSNWFLCFTITQTFPFLLDWSPYGTFWIYSGVCFLGTLFVFWSVPETKNRSLEEISRGFS